MCRQHEPFDCRKLHKQLSWQLSNIQTPVTEVVKDMCDTSGKIAETTHAKISHLVTSLSTSRQRQQVVFALLVTSCQQVWNKLLTNCNNLVDIIRLVTRFVRLFQQVRYSHDIAVLLQLTTLCRQPCNIFVCHDLGPWDGIAKSVKNEGFVR
jgi:hypothetical protein